jgi:hypothetical protein
MMIFAVVALYDYPRWCGVGGVIRTTLLLRIRPRLFLRPSPSHLFMTGDTGGRDTEQGPSQPVSTSASGSLIARGRGKGHPRVRCLAQPASPSGVGARNQGSKHMPFPLYQDLSRGTSWHRDDAGTFGLLDVADGETNPSGPWGP